MADEDLFGHMQDVKALGWSNVPRITALPEI
jgi:hypothetical protein